ncbi:MAG: hypothetical protein FWE31_03315 [Firmicutes bacterium]|nr:hypothetical protein [Bacillota bacterium]
MKKFLLSLALLAFVVPIAFIMTACTGDDEYKNGGGTPTPPPPASLEQPTNLNVNAQSILTWTSVVGAASYNLQIDGQNIIAVPAMPTSFAIGLFLQVDEQHTVRLQAVHTNDELNSGWAQITHTMEPSLPRINSPLNIRFDTPVVGDAILLWDAVAGAVAYQICVDGERFDVLTSETSFSFADNDIALPGIFDIRVRAIGNNITNSLSLWTVENEMVSVMRLATPTWNDLGSWNSVDNAVNYTITRSARSGPLNIASTLVTGGVTEISPSFMSGGSNGNSYNFFVRANAPSNSQFFLNSENSVALPVRMQNLETPTIHFEPIPVDTLRIRLSGQFVNRIREFQLSTDGNGVGEGGETQIRSTGDRVHIAMLPAGAYRFRLSWTGGWRYGSQIQNNDDLIWDFIWIRCGSRATPIDYFVAGKLDTPYIASVSRVWSDRYVYVANLERPTTDGSVLINSSNLSWRVQLMRDGNLLTNDQNQSDYWIINQQFWTTTDQMRRLALNNMAGGSLTAGGTGYFPAGEYRVRVQLTTRPGHESHGILDSDWSEWFDFAMT